MGVGDTHPWIEIKIGEDYISSVPPRYIQSFIYTSSAGGSDTFELSMIDPTFGELETKLVAAMREYILSQGMTPGTNFGPMDIRWGFPADDVWSSGKNWWTVIINNYTPRITASGIEIHLTGYSTTKPVYPSTKGPFAGRISDVVETLYKGDPWVKELVVVPTNDPVESFHSPESSSMSRDQWVGEVLAVKAKSDQYPDEPFVLRIHGSARTVYFGPVNSQPVMREYTVFVGQSPDLISFSPTYPAGSLAGVVGTGSAANTFNPNQKEFRQFIASPLDRYVGMADYKYARLVEKSNTPVPISDKNKAPTAKDVKKTVKGLSPLKIALPSYGKFLEDTAKEFRSVWERLYFLIDQAAAQHYGTPGTTGLLGGDKVKYTVKLPNGDIHWTSGTFFLLNAVHRISGGTYLIDTNMTKLWSER